VPKKEFYLWFAGSNFFERLTKLGDVNNGTNVMRGAPDEHSGNKKIQPSIS
jgi:hypothetical protein